MKEALKKTGEKIETYRVGNLVAEVWPSIGEGTEHFRKRCIARFIVFGRIKIAAKVSS